MADLPSSSLMDSHMAKPMSMKLSGVDGGYRVSDLGPKKNFEKIIYLIGNRTVQIHVT